MAVSLIWHIPTTAIIQCILQKQKFAAEACALKKQTVFGFSHLLDVGRQACVDGCLQEVLVVRPMVVKQVHQEPSHFG